MYHSGTRAEAPTEGASVTIISFTGTRDGMTAQQRLAVIDLIGLFRPAGAVHGDCIGADAHFHYFVRAYQPDGAKCPITIRPSNIDAQRANCKGDVVLPPAPPLDRNQLIVLDGNILIATPRTAQEEIRSGTWATIRFAIGRRRMVLIVEPDGRVAPR